ncbi:hypothetical protein Cgig2_029725 [Carnegiea gigantea]|uniref:Uncharacterized protein n=1 Tax=Carnegiea gigantea TaxID=171969 RepID=A0A9Q1KAA1_9CARY|nr:hypothetical protein Cgig2_029725 [Carnegiea gigantea]
MLASGRGDKDLDLHNPRYTNVHSLELEEHTDETHTPQIGKEMNINANETETLQTGKERHSNEIYSKDAHKVLKKKVPGMLLIELTIRKRGSIEQKVAQKVFKSKSRDSVVGFGGGVKEKDIRGPSHTRVKLEVELNATRKKNEVLIDRVTTVKVKNKNLRNCTESVEAKMGKFKDCVSKQLNITIPPCTNIENGNARAGSSFQVLVLFHYLATRCKIISFLLCF